MNEAATLAYPRATWRRGLHPLSDATGPASCIHCQTALVGPFCHACGQDNTRRDKPLGDLMRSALSENFNLDGQVLASVRAMITAPGALLAAYRDGRTQGFVSPIKLFLVVSAAFFLMLVWTDLAIYQFLPERTGAAPITARLAPRGVELIGGGLEDVFLSPRASEADAKAATRAMAALRPLADPVQAQAIDDFTSYIGAWDSLNETLDRWLPRLLWLLIPIYALMLWPFYRGRRFAEHVLFALWAHTVIFVLLMAYALLNKIGWSPNFWLLTIPYLAYFTLAAKTYYGEVWWKSLLKGGVHITLFFSLVWAPIVVGIAFAVARDQIPQSFWFDADMGADDAFDRWLILPPEAP